jgi:hypothetical protein
MLLGNVFGTCLKINQLIPTPEIQRMTRKSAVGAEVAGADEGAGAAPPLMPSRHPQPRPRRAKGRQKAHGRVSLRREFLTLPKDSSRFAALLKLLN